MTEAQSDSGRDFHADALIVFKHWRFIVVLFVAALLVALLAGLIAGKDYTAKSVVEIEIEPIPALAPSRNDYVPDADAFEKLATSEDVAADVAARLDDGRTPAELLELVDTRSEASTPTNPLETVFIEVNGTSKADARNLGAAWTEAFVEKAEATSVDPQALSLLETAEQAARDRLAGLDPTASRELDGVSETLRATRARLSTTINSLSATDKGLAFIEAHPEATLSDLRVALSAVLAEMNEAPFDTVAELEAGLRLRRDFLNASVPDTQAEIDELVLQEEELTREASEYTSAEEALASAEEALATARLLTETGFVTADVTSGPSVSGGVGWLARAGAAAAFALVVGVAGAFALEYLAPYLRSWRRRSGWAPPEEG